VIGALTAVIIVGSLAAAAWCFATSARNEFVHRGHLVLLGAVEALVLLQGIIAVVRIAGGERPEELATFVGYLATAVLMVPAGVAVAFMERTKYGSIIAGAAGLVLAVLALRLQQVWTPLQ